MDFLLLFIFSAMFTSYCASSLPISCKSTFQIGTKLLTNQLYFLIMWYSGNTKIPKEFIMDIIQRKSLSEIVAGKLAELILNGTYQAGYQLPAERDLVKQFGISRTTLREALKALEEINAI